MAKNYLSEKELSELNSITTSFLDFAESRARRHVITTMEDWKHRLEQFLTMNDYKTTESAGTVSQEEAREKAYGEYDKFKVIQDRTFVSDFDKFNGESVSGSDTPLLPFDINSKSRINRHSDMSLINGCVMSLNGCFRKAFEVEEDAR